MNYQKRILIASRIRDRETALFLYHTRFLLFMTLSLVYARRILKILAAYLLYYSGFVFLVQNIFLTNRCVVLVYHRIVRPEDGETYIQDGMYVKPDVFESHLRYLKKHFNFIDELNLFSILSGSGKFDKSCLLTFDDGWRDNYQNAFPLLQQFDIPATIFLATDYIDSPSWFWPERLSYYLTRTNPLDFQKTTHNDTRILLANYHQNFNSQESRINTAVDYCKRLTPSTRENIIAELTQIVGNNELLKRRVTLTWDEVNKMKKARICFGSHTKSHAILPLLKDTSQIYFEVRESKAAIENMTRQPVLSFCFPNGDSSVELQSIIRECGYKIAFSGDRGHNTYRTDPYRLKRIGIHNDIAWSLPMFACRLIFPFF